MRESKKGRCRRNHIAAPGLCTGVNLVICMAVSWVRVSPRRKELMTNTTNTAFQIASYLKA